VFNIYVLYQNLNLTNYELKIVDEGFFVLSRIFFFYFQKYGLNVSDFIWSFDSFLVHPKIDSKQVFFNFKLKRWWFSQVFSLLFLVSLQNQMLFWIEDQLMFLKKRNLIVNRFVLNFLSHRFACAIIAKQ
jgi:hypothetical protein